MLFELVAESVREVKLKGWCLCGYLKFCDTLAHQVFPSVLGAGRSQRGTTEGFVWEQRNHQNLEGSAGFQSVEAKQLQDASELSIMATDLTYTNDAVGFQNW